MIGLRFIHGTSCLKKEDNMDGEIVVNSDYEKKSNPTLIGRIIDVGNFHTYKKCEISTKDRLDGSLYACKQTYSMDKNFCEDQQCPNKTHPLTMNYKCVITFVIDDKESTCVTFNGWNKILEPYENKTVTKTYSQSYNSWHEEKLKHLVSENLCQITYMEKQDNYTGNMFKTFLNHSPCV